MAGNADTIELSDTLKVSLKDYIESRFLAMEKAETLARGDLERRLNELNQLRKEVLADRALYVTREVYERLHERIQTEVTGLGTAISTMQTAALTLSASRQSMTAMRVTIIGFVLTCLQIGQGLLIYIFLHK